MSSADRTSPERTELEVRWNQRFFWRNILVLIPVFLGYIAIAVFTSGTFRLIGVAGAIVLPGEPAVKYFHTLAVALRAMLTAGVPLAGWRRAWP